MSFYNIMFGKNPNTKEILSVLGLQEGYIERFRDCWVSEEDDEIQILTRTGGWNREDYKNEILTSNKYYLYDEDDDFDNTYALYHFSIPWED